MIQIADNVQQDLYKLVPSALSKEISCFVFFDNHPRDNKNIDITICTSHGEVKEFYRREVVCSVFLDSSSQAKELRILRNSECELFYIIALDDELIILSRKQNLQVHKRVNNVHNYVIEDSGCKGQACLKIVRKDDAVPLFFDDKFDNLLDRASVLFGSTPEEPYPILTNLKRKLTEAKYGVNYYEKSYKELLSLRQLAAFSSYQKTRPHSDAVLHSDVKELTVVLKIKTEKPWIKICNKKIVIVLGVLNKNFEVCFPLEVWNPYFANDDTLPGSLQRKASKIPYNLRKKSYDERPIENVHVLLHAHNQPCLVYTTKLFEKTTRSPYWREKQSQVIKKNSETAVVVVVDIKEFKCNTLSRIEFNGVIYYMKQEKEHLLPFDNVIISALNTMGDEFDVLASIKRERDERNVILALLATTEMTELCVRHIKNGNEPYLDLLNLFCTHLQMERMMSLTNAVLHRISPYHMLHGVLAIIPTHDYDWTHGLLVSLYTRSQSQVLAFIHFIHDAVPYRIIVTTSNQKITATSDQLSRYNENINTSDKKNIDYMDYGTSVLNQAATVLEYLDNCMINMHESKNPVIRNKIGKEIDLFAGGKTGYLKFRNKILEEALRSVTII